MHQKKSQKKPFIIIISLMVLNVLLLFGTYLWVQSSNERERIVDFSQATQEDSKLIFDDFTMDIKPRGGDSSAWLKDPILDEAGNELHGPSVGTIYEFTIENISNATIANWRFETEVPELLWVNNGWDGNVEFIQHRESGDHRKIINFQDYSEDIAALDHYIDHTGPMITMLPGDSVGYHPRSDEILIPSKEADDVNYIVIAGIICVADSLDAMNSNRLYRARLDKETILSELVTNKGKQFDPNVVDCVLKLISENIIKIR